MNERNIRRMALCALTCSGHWLGGGPVHRVGSGAALSAFPSRDVTLVNFF